MEQNQNTNEQLQPQEVPAVEVKESSESSSDTRALPKALEETSTLPLQSSNLSAGDLSKTDIDPKADTMEVHKHPHHVMHKKKWHEYLLEFFMLFLAVFLGFIAENIRERLVEQHREKEYLVSLLEDLKEDSAILQSQIAIHKTNIAMMDSFATILINPSLVQNSGNELYYFGRLAPRIRVFTENVRTYEQLKNSGNFRLISDRQVSDKIMSYYLKLPHIHQLEDIYAGEFVDYKKIAAQVFEPSVFIRQVNEDNDVLRITDNPPLLTTDTKTLKQLAVYAVYMNGSRKTILGYEQRLLQTATELIDFLKKRYHL